MDCCFFLFYEFVVDNVVANVVDNVVANVAVVVVVVEAVGAFISQEPKSDLKMKETDEKKRRKKAFIFFNGDHLNVRLMSISPTFYKHHLRSYYCAKKV